MASKRERDRAAFDAASREFRKKLFEILDTAESPGAALVAVQRITPRPDQPGRADCSAVIWSLSNNAEPGVPDYDELLPRIRAARARWGL